MREIFRYSLPESADVEEVEEDVALAVFVAECLHGRPQTRVEVAYYVSSDGRRCAVAVRGPAGESAARVFTGLCDARFGDAGFTVKRDPSVTAVQQ